MKLDKSLQGESKFSEIAAGVVNLYRGSETLCMSDSAGIFMNMSNAVRGTGDDSDDEDETGTHMQGRIGFSTTLDGPTSFKLPIPREQWTHVCVMCALEPRKRVMLYSDGGLVATVKDKVFNLPMKSVGAPFLSMHGYLLDMRFWGKTRSVPEVKLDMRCLLRISHDVAECHAAKKKAVSRKEKQQEAEKKAEALAKANEPNMTAEGLIGWWTFEDGGHSRRVVDVSDHRFPVAIRGGMSYLGDRRTPWFEATTMLPLSVRETIAANNSLSTDKRPVTTSTPQITIPLPSYTERNLCPFEVRRARLAQRGRALLQEKKCPNGCDNRIRKADMRFHLRHECPKRRISCRRPYCKATFLAEKQQEHETIACAAVLARESILQKAESENTPIICEDCSAKIPARHIIKHMDELCPYRLVSCPHPDCDALFPYHRMHNHLSYQCQSEAVLSKRWLIERARARTNYPRPWGFDLEYTNVGSGSDYQHIDRGQHFEDSDRPRENVEMKEQVISSS